MSNGETLRPFLERHLQSILECDVETYHATTVPELSLYEWYVTPHRIDGLDFHDFLMSESARSDSPAIAPRIALDIPERAPLDPAGDAGRAADRLPAESRDGILSESRDGVLSESRDSVPSEAREKPRQRFDLANYREQVYGDCAVCSYTLLISQASSAGTRVRSHHESRVLVRAGGQWRVVHVHKSPAWNAPYQPVS